MNTDLSYINSKYYITSTTDLNGIIISVSEAFCKISGYSESELLGQPHSIVRHPDTPKEAFVDLWNTIKNGQVWTGIIKNKKKNGDFYWVESTVEPIFNTKGEIEGYYSLRFNISSEIELKEVNGQIQKALHRFKRLFENIDSGIAILDTNALIQDANSYLCALFESEKEEFIGTSSFDCSTEEDKKIVKEIISKIVKGDILKEKIHKESIKKDGSKIWIEVTYSYFEEGLILASVNNIENFKKLEVATNLLVTQSRDAPMGEMLSMIAHQWRQPLATLGTIISKIKIKQDLNLYSKDNFNTDVQKINSIIIHLSKTIDYFKNYFKPKLEVKEEIISIFNGLTNIIEPLCERNNIKLIFNNFSDVKIKIDSRIDQVLLNIYKNSIDACFEKNKKGEVVTDINVVDNCISINISDNGGGINDEIIDKIFDPYYSTKNKNGTGLGLYMSKDIVENILSGKLTVRNTGNGACFTILLSMENNDGN